MISWAQHWGRKAVGWAGQGAELLLPPACRWCRVEGLLEHGCLCGRCVRGFVADRTRCPRCGEVAAAVDGGCVRCRQRKPAWDGVAILGAYDDELREAILRVKRPGAEELAAALGGLLIDKQRALLESARIDAVVPVPMHWWRRVCRGTSLAEDVARPVAAALGLATLKALARSRSTRMQNEVPAAERAANVSGAFRVRARVDGRRVLLVDDVVTTGSTLAACCRALRDAGARAVFAAVLAKADFTRDVPDREAWA